MDAKTFNIQTPHDVGQFFFWIVFEQHINFHPDDSFGQYVDCNTHKPTFAPTVANYYDMTMQRCFLICDKFNRDIYEIAGRVLKLYHYCDCNDKLAGE